MSTSVRILIVDKGGSIKELNWKNYVESEIYKKAGFRNDEEFKERTNWKVKLDTKKYNISLYAKTKGRAGQENKYDYPPPVDKELYFGSNVLINYDNDGNPRDLKLKEWEKVYEHLFGGFEDLNDEEESSDETDIYNDLEKTKHGYAKDDFIVDDDEDDDDDYECESELSEEEYI